MKYPLPLQAAGSSPRIRGEFIQCDIDGAGLGIIPANTGRITFTGVTWYPEQDHPREYGENYGWTH